MTRNRQIKIFTSNLGSQHPIAHGVSRSVLEMNGEVVERAEPRRMGSVALKRERVLLPTNLRNSLVWSKVPSLPSLLFNATDKTTHCGVSNYLKSIRLHKGHQSRGNHNIRQ